MSYSLDFTSSKVLWTSYKLTEKVGVNGVFDAVTFSSETSSGTISEILLNTEAKIAISGLNSTDAVRDKKIKETFFGTLNTDTIVGRVSAVDKNDVSIDFTLNGISKTIVGKLEQKEAKLVWTGNIDLQDFDGNAAIDALNAVCEAKHTSTDGVAKLWPDVLIKWVIKTQVSEK